MLYEVITLTFKNGKILKSIDQINEGDLLETRLADEAFLRRLGYKVYVGAVSESERNNFV